MTMKGFLDYLAHTLCYGAICMFYFGFVAVGILYAVIGDTIFLWVVTILASIAIGSVMAVPSALDCADDRTGLKRNEFVACSALIIMVAIFGSLGVFSFETTTKEETETISIPYETSYETSGLLLEGEQKTISQGQNGEKTIKYRVTRKLRTGEEVKREQISENISKTAKNEVVVRGTGTTETIPSTTPNTNTYSGGGAICNDGTRSYSTGRGTCSHHGGVDRWL